jgi:hypothetical protein
MFLGDSILILHLHLLQRTAMIYIIHSLLADCCVYFCAYLGVLGDALNLQ